MALYRDLAYLGFEVDAPLPSSSSEHSVSTTSLFNEVKERTKNTTKKRSLSLKLKNWASQKEKPVLKRGINTSSPIMPSSLSKLTFSSHSPSLRSLSTTGLDTVDEDTIDESSEGKQSIDDENTMENSQMQKRRRTQLIIYELVEGAIDSPEDEEDETSPSNSTEILISSPPKQILYSDKNSITSHPFSLIDNLTRGQGCHLPDSVPSTPMANTAASGLSIGQISPYEPLQAPNTIASSIYSFDSGFHKSSPTSPLFTPAPGGSGLVTSSGATFNTSFNSISGIISGSETRSPHFRSVKRNCFVAGPKRHEGDFDPFISSLSSVHSLIDKNSPITYKLATLKHSRSASNESTPDHLKDRPAFASDGTPVRTGKAPPRLYQQRDSFESFDSFERDHILGQDRSVKQTESPGLILIKPDETPTFNSTDPFGINSLDPNDPLSIDTLVAAIMGPRYPFFIPISGTEHLMPTPLKIAKTPKQQRESREYAVPEKITMSGIGRYMKIDDDEIY